MKTLYIDCGMGAAGDMLTAGLLELFPNPDHQMERLNAIGIPHVRFVKETSVKCGIQGTHVSVKIHGKEEHCHEHEPSGHTHEHNTLHGIEHIVEHLNLSETVKKQVLAVYRIIAEAESHVHQTPISEIHFHEVGTLDAIADVTAVCFLLDQLAPEKILVSPVHVGSGQVRCAHGLLPVPAPATAYILQHCPIYGGKIQGELCTPTGAALLKYFADGFEEMPVMSVSSIGYGMGQKDFEAANCVRLLLGETEASRDLMYELQCNVDDMTGEQMGFALERFLELGAADAFTVPIHMKKSRPGTMICVICTPESKETLTKAMFQYTSTAGIRERKTERSILKRYSTETETPYGSVRRKDYSGYGVKRSKYEYEDLARIAKQENLSIEEVLSVIKNTF